jgi:hypothetical protein
MFSRVPKAVASGRRAMQSRQSSMQVSGGADNTASKVWSVL